MTDTLHDFITHRENWRTALEMARDSASPGAADENDASYWQHELNAFDLAMVNFDLLRANSGLSDASINEITHDTLGMWPSFEAQSWACKVTHEVVKKLRVGHGVSGYWRIEEWKTWKGLDPVNARWGDLGFACATYDSATGLMDYGLQANPNAIRRVVFTKFDGVA